MELKPPCLGNEHGENRVWRVIMVLEIVSEMLMEGNIGQQDRFCKFHKFF